METRAYVVSVDDNYHYMDESERYDHGRFATYEEAEAGRWDHGNPKRLDEQAGPP